MIENFYRDIAALREPVPPPVEETGVSDLTSWVITQMDVRSGDSVLDMGSGNGKRTLPLAQLVGERGYVLAVDRSFEALSALSQQSLDARLETRIRFLQVNLDDFAGHVRKDDFDRALGSRTLHTVKHPQTVFHAIQQALKPGGIFFLYGPTRKDHAELRRFHSEACGEMFYENQEPGFVESTGLQCIQENFSDREIVFFEQILHFDSPEAIYACWSMSRLYDKALENAFQQTATRYFATHAFFETVQRIIGIRAIK
jgi:SAM-dependent methyltransferase